MRVRDRCEHHACPSEISRLKALRCCRFLPFPQFTVSVVDVELALSQGAVCLATNLHLEQWNGQPSRTICTLYCTRKIGYRAFAITTFSTAWHAGSTLWQHDYKVDYKTVNKMPCILHYCCCCFEGAGIILKQTCRYFHFAKLVLSSWQRVLEGIDPRISVFLRVKRAKVNLCHSTCFWVLLYKHFRTSSQSD